MNRIAVVVLGVTTLSSAAAVRAQTGPGGPAEGEAPEAEPPQAQPTPGPTPDPAAKPKAAEPFAFADFSWMPGNYGASERPLSFKAFTGEFRVDTAYHYSFNHPQDNTISGSSEVFRHNEFQLTQLGVGGDLNY